MTQSGSAPGTAIATWSYRLSSFLFTEARQFAGATNTWGPVADIACCTYSYPKVGIDSEGRALVAIHNGSSSSVARFDPVTGWDNNSATLGAGVYPSVATASNGAAVGTWLSSGQLLGRRYFEDTKAWGPPVTVSDTPVSGEQGNTSIAMNPAGTAAAVWAASDRATIRARIYDPNTDRWSVGTEIGTSNGTGLYLFRPVVAIDGDGTVTVVWGRATSTTASVIEARRFRQRVGMGPCGPAIVWRSVVNSADRRDQRAR